jgi:hypothetical protein
MYRESLRDEHRNTLWGRGFNIAGKLQHPSEIDRTLLSDKIRDRHFDFVIFGSVHRCMDYYEIVKQSYPPSRIVFIDGEDDCRLREDLIGNGIYFKRELYQDQSKDNVHPISFAIPKEQIITADVQKDKLLAITSCGRLGYVFRNEDDYNREYQRSYFGLTQKKSGWDCFRHYEICANGALPVFYDLPNLPSTTMTRWDKELLKETTRFLWNFREGCGMEPEYEHYKQRVLQMVRNDLTTESAFRYILNFIE